MDDKQFPVHINIEVTMNIDGDTEERAIFNAQQMFHDRRKLAHFIGMYFAFAPQDVIEDQIKIKIDDEERYELNEYFSEDI